jgi:quinol monooxygenase YgiN
MFDVIVTQRVKPGSEGQVDTLLRELRAEVLNKENGCVRYEAYCSEAPSTFVVLGRWRDETAARAHLHEEHTSRALSRLAEYAEERFKMMRLTPLD